MNDIPVKTLERLILYKRILNDLSVTGIIYCFSHQLAGLANNSSALVRRDLMSIGYSGSSGNGYNIQELLAQIDDKLKAGTTQKLLLAGVGNLGRAILSYFSYQQPGIEIVAAFDSDPEKTGRVIAGCHCYKLSALSEIINKFNINIGIITVPPGQAQKVAEELIDAGIKGILNFAPIPLHVPAGIHVQNMDITKSLDKLAYLCQL